MNDTKKKLPHFKNFICTVRPHVLHTQQLGNFMARLNSSCSWWRRVPTNVTTLDASPQHTSPTEHFLSVTASTSHQPEAVLEPAARAMGPVLGDFEVFCPSQEEFGFAFWTRLYHCVREGVNVYIYLAVSILKRFTNAE